MKPIKFFKKHEIEFLPMLIKYNDETKKKELLLNETKMILGYIPKMTDFTQQTKEELHRRQDDFIKNYERHCEMADEIDDEAYWVFGIDTHFIFIIDVDDDSAKGVMEPLMKRHPYYLSTSKQLPKIFFTDGKLAMNRLKNIKYMNKRVEVQKGQWSFIDVEGTITHEDKDIPQLDFEEFIRPHNTEAKRGRTMLQVPLQRDIAEHLEVPLCFIENNRLFKLCECLSGDRWDDWDDWFKIGCALKSDTFSYAFHIWKYFSMNSNKYTPENWEENGKDKTTWDNIKVMDGGISVGSLHHWAKEDNPDLYQEKFGSTYDKVKQRTEKILFKINSPPSYGVINVDNVMALMNENKLQTRFGDLWYEELVLDKKTGEKKVQQFLFTKKWLTDPEKRCYEKIVFDPRPHVDPRFYNLFEGFMVKKGHYDDAYVDQIKEYILHRLCDGNEKFQEFMLWWLAHIIQKPWNKTRVCIVIRGIQGTGKGLFTNFFGNQILGNKYYASLERINSAVGKFNARIMNKLLVNLNEVEMKDTIDQQGKVKCYITDEEIDIERKHEDAFPISNHMNFIATTNKDAPFVIEYSDRRYACIESHSPRLTNEEIQHFTQFFQNPDVAYSFYKYLKELELPKENLEFLRPETEFYRDCKVVVAPPHLKFLAHEMEASLSPKYKYFISFETLYSRYRSYMSQYYNTDKKIINDSTFKRYFKAIPGITRDRNNNTQGYSIEPSMLKDHLKSLHLYED
jgi:hypothetical protein